MVAETSGGCLLGAAAVGEKGKPAQDVGAAAAQELVSDVHAGGCVDQWFANGFLLDSVAMLDVSSNCHIDHMLVPPSDLALEGGFLSAMKRNIGVCLNAGYKIS